MLQAVGRFDDAHALVTVLASGEPRDAADLAALPVAVGADGSPVPLSAIAEVVEGAEDRLLRVVGPGRRDRAASASRRLPGASTPDVVARVRAAVARGGRDLPAGVHGDAGLRPGRARRRVDALGARRDPDRHRAVRAR